MFSPDRANTPVSASFANASSSSSSAPITRSRTLFFLSVRSTFGHPATSRRPYGSEQYQHVESDDDEAAGLMGSGGRSRSKGKGKARDDGRPGETRLEMSGLPPIWVDISDEVTTLLDQVKTKTASLDKMHAKHVLPGFKDRSGEERDIEAMTQSITRDFRKAQDLIKRIRPEQASEAEHRSTLNLQRGLAAKVQDLSAGFRKKQRSYMEKLQGHASKSESLLKTSGAAMLMSREQEMVALEDDLQATEQVQPNPLGATIQRRTNEITNIAKSIAELADLFRDLGDLVVEQGTMMDSIEYNIETVGREMKASVEELEVATQYQKNTGRRKCIFLLVLIIVGLVLVLIYKPRSHSSPAADAPAASPPIASVASDSVRLVGRCKRPLGRASPFALASSREREALDGATTSRPRLVRRRRRKEARDEASISCTL